MQYLIGHHIAPLWRWLKRRYKCHLHFRLWNQQPEDQQGRQGHETIKEGGKRVVRTRRSRRVRRVRTMMRKMGMWRW